MALALALGGAAVAARAADPARERRVAELKDFLAKKEHDLARLGAEHATKAKEAEALGRQVDSLKQKPDRSWMEQRTLEKLLARGRVQLEEIERLTAGEQEVREEAFAAAAAITTELEDLMQEDLVTLRDAADPVARQKLTDRVLLLERDRRVYQGKMNGWAPAIPAPAEIPAGAQWTPEMVEDQRRAYEAAVARLQAEREQLVQEQRLRRNLRESLPGATVTKESESADARIGARIAELDRRIKLYREKSSRLAPHPAGGG